MAYTSSQCQGFSVAVHHSNGSYEYTPEPNLAFLLHHCPNVASCVDAMCIAIPYWCPLRMSFYNGNKQALIPCERRCSRGGHCRTTGLRAWHGSSKSLSDSSTPMSSNWPQIWARCEKAPQTSGPYFRPIPHERARLSWLRRARQARRVVSTSTSVLVNKPRRSLL